MNPSPPLAPRRRAATALVVAALALTACGQQASSGDDEQRTVAKPLVITYDGGLYIVDGESMKVAADIELPGFNRPNAAGDGRHALVSTSSGFQVLDAAAGKLTGDQFEAEAAGHVVTHADKTVLFADGTGEAVSFDPDELGDELPATDTYRAEQAHHGVAVALADGGLLVTVGDEETRTGARVVDADGTETAASDQCPGVHGEATAEDETIVLGCADGVLAFADGEFTKIDSPDEEGAVGTQVGHEDSAYILGDYKTDPDAELERSQTVSITDTASRKMRTLDLETSYSSRSLARGPHGEGVVLGTDGAVHVIDLAAAEITDSFPVVDGWREPLDWQKTRPSVFVRGHLAYVNDPASSTVHALDLTTGDVVAEAELPEPGNYLSAP